MVLCRWLCFLIDAKMSRFQTLFLSEDCEICLIVSARCLINVQPEVRLARFMRVDISIRLRLRPKSICSGEEAEARVALPDPIQVGSIKLAGLRRHFYTGKT